MRLAIINQFYPPDLAPTGKLAASLAEHRARLGDQVTILTSRGGYVPQSPVRKSKHAPNLRVIRLWTPRLGKKTLPARVIDYGFFYTLAAIRMATLEQQDVVIAMTTPPFIGLAGALHKRLHRGCVLLLWNMDSYPEVPERAGVVNPNGLLGRSMQQINQRLFAALDHVVCLDDAMQRRITSRHGARPRTSVIHNWEPAKDFPIDLNPAPRKAAGELGLEERFVVLYLGNAGYGHRFETILDAAEGLRDEPVSFLFVGGGHKWKWLAQAKRQRGLNNLRLNGYISQPETRSIMAAADCALVTLRDSFLGVISPSKIHANLAMGLPLIYVGPAGGNVDEAIQRFDCGISLRHGDVEGIAGFVRRLMADPRAHAGFSSRARAAFEQAYSDAVALPKFDRLLDALVSGD